MTITGATISADATQMMSNSETTVTKNITVKLPTGIVETTFTVLIRVIPCSIQTFSITNMSAAIGVREL